MALLLENAAFTFSSVDVMSAACHNPQLITEGFFTGFFIYDPLRGWYTIGNYSSCSAIGVYDLYIADCLPSKTLRSQCGFNFDGTWKFSTNSFNAAHFVSWLGGIECVWLEREGFNQLRKVCLDMSQSYYD